MAALGALYPGRGLTVARRDPFPPLALSSKPASDPLLRPKHAMFSLHAGAKAEAATRCLWPGTRQSGGLRPVHHSNSFLLSPVGMSIFLLPFLCFISQRHVSGVKGADESVLQYFTWTGSLCLCKDFHADSSYL